MRKSATSGDHFVMKRGHHGRFRFAMLSNGGRIAGEVRIEVVGADREALRVQALARISSLAKALCENAAMAASLDAADRPAAGIGSADTIQGAFRGAI